MLFKNIAVLAKISKRSNKKDENVSGVGIEVCSGRKWKTIELLVAEERLREKAILGTVAKSCTGLGFFF